MIMTSSKAVFRSDLRIDRQWPGLALYPDRWHKIRTLGWD